MSILLAIIIAIIQGVTELFPVSSLGHAVILPAILGMPIDERSIDFLPFLVVLHLGTAIALLFYFWRDWLDIFLGIFAKDDSRRTAKRRILSLVIVATIPAVILGFSLEHAIRTLFVSPVSAAIFLTLNGFLLFFGEKSRKYTETKNGTDLIAIEQMGMKEALIIGFWQCTAFFPGISRSGATILGGLLIGLSHRASAYFSFLIATPVIFGAAVLEIPKLIHHGGGLAAINSPVIIGGIFAGVTAWASIAFLMHYFGQHEIKALKPFAIYCWCAGLISLTILLIG